MEQASKDAFMAAISHELRTPLNAILGLAQLLDSPELNAVQRSQARTLLEAGRALRIALDDILIMTEMNSNAVADCDPTLAARAVTHLMQPVAWAKNLSLSVVSARDVPRVALDSHGVRQALYKLTDNAVKYTISGRIEVRVEAIRRGDAPFVRFSVSDTGPGIPPEIGEKLFHEIPTYSRYVRRRHGSGFGLMIVRQIVDAAGGLCGFDSQLGEGSTFWFVLPAIQQNCGRPTAEDATQAPPPEGLRLLAFLDNDSAHKELEEILTPYGNHLTFARVPADLVAIAARSNFDAAIVRVDFADMLAGAPGVRLPILALVTPDTGNIHASGAGETRNWPCAAWHIYGALNHMLARELAQEEGHAPPPAEVIDQAAITALEKSVGEDTLIEIFRSYLESAEKIHAGLDCARNSEDLTPAEGLARDITGSASGLGFAAATLSARNLTAAFRDKESDLMIREKIDALIGDCERTKLALQALYPELAR